LRDRRHILYFSKKNLPGVFRGALLPFRSNAGSAPGKSKRPTVVCGNRNPAFPLDAENRRDARTAEKSSRRRSADPAAAVEDARKIVESAEQEIAAAAKSGAPGN